MTTDSLHRENSAMAGSEANEKLGKTCNSCDTQRSTATATGRMDRTDQTGSKVTRAHASDRCAHASDRCVRA